MTVLSVEQRAQALTTAETLLQTPFFPTELERHQFVHTPQDLDPVRVAGREILLDEVVRLLPDELSIDQTAMTHAATLRMAARQLIVLARLEEHLDGRTPPDGMQEANAAGDDALARIVRFLQRNNQAQVEPAQSSIYNVLVKAGLVTSATEIHQDHLMATLLREAGIGKPANEAFPAPLKALIVAPSDRDTYRIARRRIGNATMRSVAPGLTFITTRRYRQLLSDQGGNVVVTSPEYLTEAVVSGRMTNTQFDLVLTDGLTPSERTQVAGNVHVQRISPTVIHFALGPGTQATEGPGGDAV